MLSNYIIYSRVLRHPRFYIMEQFQYRFAEIGSKWFLFVIWKKFPVFQVTYYRSTPKNHAYLNDPQCYTWLLKKYSRLHRVNISKILGNVWLLLVLFLCTPPSSSTLRFPQSSSMNRNLGKFSINTIKLKLFLKYSNFFWRVVFFNETVIKNKTREMKQVSVCERSCLDIFSYLLLWLCRKYCNKSKSNKIIG